MVERGPYVSCANCGLPYHIGGVIENEPSLLAATEQAFRSRFAIDCRARCEVVSVSPQKKTVELKNHATGEATSERYDRLVLSPGAAPIRRWTSVDVAFLLDVRNPAELAALKVPGAVSIPLPELRARVGEFPRDCEIHVICRSAQRAYCATRVLLQNGFKARNLSGGMMSRSMLLAERYSGY